MKNCPHIMVVDDDQDTLKIVGRTLELEGYAVSLANGGKEALALLEERHPDLVVLDVMMPELDGFQVLEHLRRRTNVPVIMLTARREPILLQKALVMGADDYLRKPFRPLVLVARIRAKLRRAAAEVILPGVKSSTQPQS
ncbi:MAG: response regulator transcription factor [Chloroflexi bacterium]|nr:response regulator transcription factor [Chloroflexota bacterium]